MDKIREMTDEERQRATERYKANHGSSRESLRTDKAEEARKASMEIKDLRIRNRNEY